MAAKVNVEPERPRIAGRQAHRNNAPTTENDLPHPELLEQEIFHWKTFWINNKKELPETAAAAMKARDKRTFPNIYVSGNCFVHCQ